VLRKRRQCFVAENYICLTLLQLDKEIFPKKTPRNPYEKWLLVKCFKTLQKGSSQHVD